MTARHQSPNQGPRTEQPLPLPEQWRPEVEPARERTLLDWLWLIRDGWKALVLCVVIGLVASVVATVRQPKAYGAQGTVLVTPIPGFLDPSQADALPALTDTVARLVTQNRVLRSAASSFVTAAGADAALARQRRQLATIDWLRGHVRAQQVGTSPILVISGSAPTQPAAVALTHALIRTVVSLVNMATPKTANGGISLRVFSDAEATGRVSPTPVRNALIGINAGLVLGTAFALLVGATRRRLRHPRQLASAVGAPLLGVVRDPRDSNPAAVPRSFADACDRLLRRRRSGVVLLTGPSGSENIPNVAEALGRAVAATGIRTVVVDGRAVFSERALEWQANARGSDAFSIIRAAEPLGAIRKARAQLTTPPPARDGATLAAGVEERITQLANKFDLVLVGGPSLASSRELTGLVSIADSIVIVTRPRTMARQLDESRWFLADLDRRAEGVIVVD